MKHINRMLVGVGVLGVTPTVVADFALTNLDLDGAVIPGGGTVQGWEFKANDDITVTHLGLADMGLDGFMTDHPIGLFDLTTMSLLTSGVMSAGAGDPLIDEFRYVDTSDVTLMVGRAYVIAYYSDQDFSDAYFRNATFDVDPAITYVQGRFENLGSGLSLPGIGTDETRIGPNFQFVPAPPVLVLFGIAGLGVRRRRRG